MADPVRTSSNDHDDAAFAEGAITFWSNLLARIDTHLLEADS